MADLKRINALYFYPPIYFKEVIELPDCRSIDSIDKPVESFSFNDDYIFISKEGYIATNTDDQDISEDIFNSIFLSTSLLKYSVLRAVKNEIDIVEIVNTLDYVHIIKNSLQTARQYLHIFPKIRKDFLVKVITEYELEIILQLAEKIFNSKFKLGILTFYDGYTRFNFGDYTGSFIMNWMTIEYYLSRLLEEYFQRNGVFQELIDKLNRDWNVNKKTKYLHDGNEINDTDNNKYNEQRKIRNNIIHSNYNPTPSESEECKNISNSIMEKLFNMEDIDLTYYHNKMKENNDKK